MTHVDRIKPTRLDHVIAFATGATVCIGATAAITAAVMTFHSHRGIL
jgi:hypothetical protein